MALFPDQTCAAGAHTSNLRRRRTKGVALAMGASDAATVRMACSQSRQPSRKLAVASSSSPLSPLSWLLFLHCLSLTACGDSCLPAVLATVRHAREHRERDLGSEQSAHLSASVHRTHARSILLLQLGHCTFRSLWAPSLAAIPISTAQLNARASRQSSAQPRARLLFRGARVPNCISVYRTTAAAAAIAP